MCLELLILLTSSTQPPSKQMFSIRAAPISSEPAMGWKEVKKPKVRVCVTTRAPATPALLHRISNPAFLPSLQLAVQGETEGCKDYNSQNAVLLSTEQSRLGMLCPSASFSIGKREGRVGEASKGPQQPLYYCLARCLPGALPQPLCSEWMKGRRGAMGKPVGALGSGSAWGQS